MKKKWCGSVVAGLVGLGSLAFGEAMRQPLELNRVLLDVREHNSAIRVARLDVEQARAAVRSSRAWPDPTIGVEYWGVPRPGLDLGAADQRLLDVAQEIPFPIKTWAAGRVARHDLHRREAGAERVVQDQVLAAKQAFWDLWAATASANALGVVATTLDDLAKLSDRRNRLGQVGRMEQLMDPMAKMARLDLDNDRLMLAQERAAAQAALNALMARDPGTALADPVAPPPIPEAPDEDDVLRRALAGRAELTEARHHVLHMQSGRRLAEAGWVPDLMIQASLVDTRQGAPMSMVMAKINVPFVWFWRQAADVAAASRMVEQATVDLDGMERDTRAMAITELAAFRADRARLIRLEREVVPLAEAAVHLGVSGYRSGSVGVADALGTVTAYQAAILQAIRLRAQVGRDRAALERLICGSLESTDDKENNEHAPH